MFELVVVWADGQENSIWEYPTEEKAEQAASGIKTALGNQVEWIGIRKKAEG